MLKVGLIGAGNMGRAIVRGITGELLPCDRIYVTDISKAKIDRLCDDLKVKPVDNLSKLLSETTLIIYAAKPNNVPEVFPELAQNIKPTQLIISIAAGISTSTMESYFSEKIPIIRAMPNVAASVMASITALARGKYVNDEQFNLAQELFDCLGKSMPIEERLIDAVTGLSGSGPAFIFLFVEALIDGGVHVGLSRSDASELAVQTVIGAGKLLEQSEKSPSSLRSTVTTPAGTTSEGLYRLERGNFRATIISAVMAATNRSKELSSRLG